MTIPEVDVTSSAFKANPFPWYAQVRAEAPVYPVTIASRRERAWLVTRYADVVAVLKDERLLKNRRNAMTPEQLARSTPVPPRFASLQRSLLSLDDGDHDRLRALVHQAFTLRMIEGMRDHIQAVVHDLLDAAAAKGQMDLITDYALPLPLTIIGRILGVPASDNDQFHHWTKVVITIGTNPNPLSVVPSITSMIEYLNELIAARRTRPQEDLITALVAAQEGDDRLSDEEIVAMIFLLLSAGHETTLNLIGSGTLAVLQHPDQWARLRAEPEIAKPAIEELLRYVCPAEMATERFASEDLTIAGTTIPRGEMVMGVIAAANRDPAMFDQPDMLDLTRANNKHLAFGQGLHYCLGAPLARLEGQIALPSLTRRFPHLRLAIPAEQLQWRGGFILRGLEALPVTW